MQILKFPHDSLRTVVKEFDFENPITDPIQL